MCPQSHKSINAIPIGWLSCWPRLGCFSSSFATQVLLSGKGWMVRLAQLFDASFCTFHASHAYVCPFNCILGVIPWAVSPVAGFFFFLSKIGASVLKSFYNLLRGYDSAFISFGPDLVQRHLTFLSPVQNIFPVTLFLICLMCMHRESDGRISLLDFV